MPRLHPHCLDRLQLRGASAAEVLETVESGTASPALHGRTLFQKTFPFDSEWRGKRYATKTVEAYAVFEDGGWLVITTIVKFGGRLP